MASGALTGARPSGERLFYLGMVGLIWAAVFWGFSQSVFLRPLFPKVVAAHEPIFYVHGALFFTWLALLAVQTWLIATRNTALHRKLGVAAFALIPIMLAMGLYVATLGAHRPTGFTGVAEPKLHFLGVLVAWMAMFAVFAGLALYWRRDPQTHKRLMLLAAINLTEAGVTRWPIAPLNVAESEMAAFWVTCAFLAPLALWDLASLKRLHPATLWGGLAFLAYGPLRDAAANTPAWQAAGQWAVNLLG